MAGEERRPPEVRYPAAVAAEPTVGERWQAAYEAWKGRVERKIHDNRLTLLLLVGMALLIAFVRLYTYDEPLERDMPTYAVLAHEMGLGKHLYSEIWDQKPPAIYLTYWVGERFFGYGLAEIYGLGVLAAWATLAGVFVAGSAGRAGKEGGLWAAAFWTIVCSDMMLQANQPNAEVFINACSIWALALFLRGDDKGWSFGRAFAIGLLFAWASLYKHVAALPAVALMVAHATFPPANVTRRSQAIGHGVVVAATIGGVWMAMIGYFIATSRLGAFYECLVVWNQFYAGSLSDNFAKLINPAMFFPPWMAAVMPLAIACGGAALAGWVANKRQWAVFIAVALGTFMAIAVPGKFFPHYYQFLLPVLAVGAAKVVMLPRWISISCPPKFTRVLGWMLVGVLLFFQLPSFLLTPADWSRAKYGDSTWVDVKQIAGDLNMMLAPNETFYQWGSEPNLYFYTRRRPPVCLLGPQPMIDGPLKGKMTNWVLGGLQKSPPDMFIMYGQLVQVTQGPNPMIRMPKHPVFEWVSANYVPSPVNGFRGPYLILVRHGSDLEARMLVAAAAQQKAEKNAAQPK